MKLKKQSRTVYKTHDGERYIFKNGVATVPGCRYKGKPLLITLKEFMQLTSE